MKTRFTLRSGMSAMFAALLLVNGCSQQNASNAPAYVTTSSVAIPGSRLSNAPEVSTPPPFQPAPVVVAEAQSTSTAAEVTTGSPIAVMPEKLRLSQPLNEVIRLTQSGVDEGVILTYITNSSAAFRLGAEEIVYLDDLGISSGVITAMMQRDQGLKVSTVASVQPVAVAPTYVNVPQPVVVQESQPVNITENYFYDSLSPYGTWIEVDGYGRCWQPTVAITTASWRPYCDRGRWMHTDAGWYWMSDYSWGSVAFHYGRWFTHPRLGWCWWPDNVWGPSWVSWRYDNDNCGWAPLPPQSYYRPGVGFTYRDRNVGFSFDFGLGVDTYTFVQWGRFCDPRPYQHCLPRHRVNTVYNQTTIINNYGDGNNNTVINRGFSTDRVRERSRAEVRTVNLRNETPRKGELRAERLESGGKTLIVPRPFLPLLPPLPGIGKISLPFEKSSTRGLSTTPAAPSNVNPQPSHNNSGEERRVSKSGRERVVTMPNSVTQPEAAAPTVKTIPQPTLPDSNRSIRNEREQKIEVGNTERERTQPMVVPRATRVETPTPARTATPIFSKPVIVETVPHAPSRPVVAPAQDSTAVIGNGRNRSGGRDYSVWSTSPQIQAQPQPSSTPQPSPNMSAPDVNRNSSRSRVVDESPVHVDNNPPSRPTPVENRPANNPRREEKSDSFERANRTERASVFRAEQRSAPPVISVPAPVVAPQPAPRPAPTFTPPPTPRIESQPAPSRPEPSRSEPRSESRSESKSESNRPKHDR